jgi:hypothetical protein
VIPRDPRRAAFREARRLFGECSEALAALVSALRLADVTGADRTLARLRKTQPLIDDWSSSLDSAVAVARISPFFHRFLPELVAQQRVLRGMDLVTRNLRIITRRIDFLIRDGKPRLQLAELLSAVSGGLNLLGQGLRDPSMFDLARQDMILVAMRLDPRLIVPKGTVNDVMIVMLLRPLLVDLLTATGMPEPEARALLPKVSGPETGAIVIAQDSDD